MTLTSSTLRRWISIAMVVVLLASLGGWLFSLGGDRVPRVIRIATAEPGGQYQQFGELLKRNIERSTNGKVRVELRTTAGSAENAKLLKDGEVDLAIVQGGAVPIEEHAVMAPLYPDVLHVVARAEREWSDVRELSGRRVILGKEGSGMLESADQVLAYFELDPSERIQSYFASLASDPGLDGAIITSGILNPELRDLLGTGEFSLLAVPGLRRDPDVAPLLLGVHHSAGPLQREPASAGAGRAHHRDDRLPGRKRRCS